jgi:hypothetical protein
MLSAGGEDARRITDDQELAELAARGSGFVIDPFNETVRSSVCEAEATIGLMVVGVSRGSGLRSGS